MLFQGLESRETAQSIFKWTNSAKEIQESEGREDTFLVRLTRDYLKLFLRTCPQRQPYWHSRPTA